MLSLLLDSCTERSIVALVEEDHCLYMAGLPFGLHNSRYLLPKIEEGFEILGKRPQDLDFITVGVGPGSYTGIRVGATVAKSLSFACKVPLIGVGSLEGFIPDCDSSFIAMIDAKMGGVYFMKGKKEGNLISYTSKPEVCSIEELEKQLLSVDVLVGPSLETLKKKIQSQYPDFNCKWQETAPDPIHLTHRALKKLENKQYSLDGSLDILYLRE